MIDKHQLYGYACTVHHFLMCLSERLATEMPELEFKLFCKGGFQTDWILNSFIDAIWEDCYDIIEQHDEEDSLFHWSYTIASAAAAVLTAKLSETEQPEDKLAIALPCPSCLQEAMVELFNEMFHNEILDDDEVSNG